LAFWSILEEIPLFIGSLWIRKDLLAFGKELFGCSLDPFRFSCDYVNC
jgi:hypothetical protein